MRLVSVVTTLCLILSPVAHAKSDKKGKGGGKAPRVTAISVVDEAKIDADEVKSLEAALQTALVGGSGAYDATAKATVTKGEDGGRVLTLVVLKDGKPVLDVTRALPFEESARAATRLAGELMAKAEQRSVQTIAVTSVPAGATVTVNGAPFGVTPIPATYVPAGELKVHFEKQAFFAADHTIGVGEGETKTDEAKLEEDPAEVARREAARAKAEADERDREEQKAKAAAEAARKAEEERASIEAFEKKARDEAELKKAAEKARVEAAKARKGLLGAFFRYGTGIPGSDVAAAQQYLADHKSPAVTRTVIGGSLRAPLFGGFWLSGDVDYWRDNYWSYPPPSGVANLLRMVPVGMVSTSLSAGRRVRLGDTFFFDASLSGGARLTRSAKHQEFPGGDHYYEVTKRWTPTAGLGLGLGARLGLVEASLGWRLQASLAKETAAEGYGGEPSIGGFGLIQLLGLQVGVTL